MDDLKSSAAEAVKNKIRKLLLHSNGTANEAEVFLYLNKAMQLMRQHQNSIASVQEEEDPIRHYVSMTGQDNGHYWWRNLFDAVATYYGCKSIYATVGAVHSKDGRTRDLFELRLIGPESSIMSTCLMWPWIRTQCKLNGRELALNTDRSQLWGDKTVANALMLRIQRLLDERTMIKEKIVSMRDEGREIPKSALVAIDLTDAVDAMFHQIYPVSKIKLTTVRTCVDSVEAAKGIGLFRPAGGSNDPA